MLNASWLTLHVVAVLFGATLVRSTLGFAEALIAVPSWRSRCLSR